MKLEKAVSKNKNRVDELMRVTRRWISGLKDEYAVDGFLKFYFAYEMLVAIKKYKKGKKYEEFRKMYLDNFYYLDIYCKHKGYENIDDIIDKCPQDKKGGRISIRWVRNSLVHEKSGEKDLAEKLAVCSADEFGLKVLGAI